MDSNWKFGPEVNIAATGGFALPVVKGSKLSNALQIGIVADNNGLRAFWGYGISTPGPILSFGVGPGNAPALNSNTTTHNAGYVLGAGYENGGWNGQFTTPGINRMNNHYFYEK